MKALVLCGGKGTRLKPITTTMPKQLLPVANKPILFNVLDQIVETGITEIGIVTSLETDEGIREAVGDGSRWNATITYILQPDPLGLAHAVTTAKEFLQDHPFLMFLGDNLIEGGVKRFVTEFKENNSDALILLKDTPNPQLFGVAELGKSGEILNIEEKPEKPKSNMVVTGVYLFSPIVHEAIAEIKPSWRNELEITHAIQKLIEMKKKVHYHILEGWWLDTGKKDDLLEANRVVLDDYTRRSIDGMVDSESQIVGRVELKEGAKVENSTVRGPVSIAGDCLIRDSFIGPFTSIGPGVLIDKSSIEHSVILENCNILNIERLADSVIGKNGRLFKREGGLRPKKLFVGDNANIEL
jgi:glucose-1-phosphate thymidylyltransferase